MKKILESIVVFWLLFNAFPGIACAQASERKMISLPAEIVVDKIRGGMFLYGFCF